jgi:predicted dehydrogenase
MSQRFTRRRFIYTTAAATGSLALLPNLTRNVLGANERLNVAGVGAGGKGESDIMKCTNAGGTIIAACDIDTGRVKSLAKKAAEKNKGNSKVETYADWRIMFEKMGKDIDAVTVSTPDHSHAVAAAMAISMGKHVYVQKPLTHTVYEARVLRQLAKEHKICSQMGNQGTSLDTLRTGTEIIQSGVLGDIKEVHCWSNRPVWDQGQKGMDAFEKGKGAAIPDGFNFDLWLGPAADRPFNAAYRHFHWRGFWDFGTGALGDMACHTMNLPFWALSLEYPTSVTAKVPKVYELCPPEWSVIKYEFPERTVVKTGTKLPPVTLTWYDGHTNGLGKPLPESERKFVEVGKQYGVEIPFGGSGAFFVGSKGAMWANGDYADRISLLPKEKFPGDYKTHAPKAWLPRHPGGDMDQNQTNEWIAAIKANKPDMAMSNFEYAAYFTEIILLGNLAMRVPGEEIKWDGPNMKSPNVAKANDFVSMEYRKGYSLKSGRA